VGLKKVDLLSRLLYFWVPPMLNDERNALVLNGYLPTRLVQTDIGNVEIKVIKLLSSNTILRLKAN
jgi:hypothetical protein